MVKKYFYGCVVLFIIVGVGSVRAQPQHVETVQHGPGQWELRVDGDPFFIQGVVYNFWAVGDDPDLGTLRDWSILDSDGNGRVDVAYDSWVDKNRNNIQDEDEPSVGDWQLLKAMGANTLRVYQMPSKDPRVENFYEAPGTRLTFFHEPNKALFRDLFENYGIMVAVGNFFGEWGIGSGGTQGTDYTDPVQRKNLLTGIKVMVEEHKDEPYTLMWILGNENFCPFDYDNAETQVEAFLSLVNEAAQLIHKRDPHHPVAICNWADHHMAEMMKLCPDIDIFGTNLYSRTFNPIWKKARKFFDRPVLITEYGMPAFSDGKVREIRQADHLQASWKDIEKNRYEGEGVGNSIGGMVFTWSDQWALNGNAGSHDFVAGARVPGEEWFGLVSLGNGSHSPFLRQLRKGYWTYQELWSE